MASGERFRAIARVAGILAAAMGFAVAHAQAYAPVAGHWLTVYEDVARGPIEGYVHVDASGILTGVIAFDPRDPETWLEYRSRLLSFDGRTLEGTYWPYQERVRFVLAMSADGSRLEGAWTLRGTSDEPEPDREGAREYDDPADPYWYTARGREVWTRLVPYVLEVDVRSDDRRALDTYQMARMWEYAFANDDLPRIAITLTLPRAQQYYRPLAASFDDERLRLWTRRDTDDPARFTYLVWLREGVEEGMKTLYLEDDAAVPFELVFERHDPGTTPEPPARPGSAE